MSLDHSRIVITPRAPSREPGNPEAVSQSSGFRVRAQEARPGMTAQGPSVAKPAAACETLLAIRTLRTKTRHVRCGRDNEQADYRAHEAKTPIQRMVQQPP